MDESRAPCDPEDGFFSAPRDCMGPDMQEIIAFKHATALIADLRDLSPGILTGMSECGRFQRPLRPQYESAGSMKPAPRR